MKMKGTVVIDEERCKGCELCVVACPSKVIGMKKEVNKKGYRFACVENEDACTGCASCGLVCPDGCISVYKVKLA